jgi:hypothetical protein
MTSEERRTFVTDGTVLSWDRRSRVLRVDGHLLYVASEVTTPIPGNGTRVTVSGHVTENGRWIVTGLMVRR